VHFQPSDRLLALTVWQPWAHLIATAQKSVELRKWGTSYRGTIVIHAARQVDDGAAVYFGLDTVSWPVGAALGVVDLVDVLMIRRDELRENRWLHRSWGPFRHGMRGLVLSSPRLLRRPIRMVGARGLFRVPPAITSEIHLQLKN
jgi:hypothetical protein